MKLTYLSAFCCRILIINQEKKLHRYVVNLLNVKLHNFCFYFQLRQI